MQWDAWFVLWAWSYQSCMGECMGPHTFCMEPPIHAWCAQYSYEHTVHDLIWVDPEYAYMIHACARAAGCMHARCSMGWKYYSLWNTEFMHGSGGESLGSFLLFFATQITYEKMRAVHEFKILYRYFVPTVYQYRCYTGTGTRSRHTVGCWVCAVGLKSGWEICAVAYSPVYFRS